MEGVIALGNQLFPPEFYKRFNAPIFMSEDRGLASHFKYHKIKIMFFFLSMRSFKEELMQSGLEVSYHNFSETSFFENLRNWIQNKSIDKIHSYEIEDKFFEQQMIDFARNNNIKFIIHHSPLFLTTRDEFKQYLDSTKRPFMKTFYEHQRKNLNILIEGDGPTGGKWSFDEENRKRIPKGLSLPPDIKAIQTSLQTEEVKRLVNENFSDHPGDLKNYWIPYTRASAQKWLKDFIDFRYYDFGTYEDAITPKGDQLFHSTIAPMLNIGLLLPSEVIDQAQLAFAEGKTKLASHEGFIRQIIGWREFVRGIYQNFDETQQKTNFFNHQANLNDRWYQGNTGLGVLDFVIKKVDRLSYAHHIERLMILGNIMLLCGTHPKEVYRWFMEMFSDSSDWVMGPNVFGMSQFSDGGIFATKPYICSSNYLIKMGWPKDESCEILDALYWNFISTHKDFFQKQYRMAFATKTLERFSAKKRHSIECLSKEFISFVTN
ncbi:MAG: cryptochrome/photolyase family protein [Halobacteriovorax sp.]|nr:cryptochrome/photolyase family protein [Halobacteriovorax sp.]|tara:strand:- start:63 stop:1532 length:1470 start_codon:yes stop_codon:yes gene_type:complete